MSFDPTTARPDEEQRPQPAQAPKQAWSFDPRTAIPEDAPPTREVMRQAVKVKPEAAAEADRLARRYPVPYEVVKRNADDFQMFDMAEGLTAELDGAPTLAGAFRKNPRLAEMAHDDIGVLSKITSALGDAARYAVSAPGTTRGLAGDVVDAGKTVGLGATVGVGKAIFDVAAVLDDFIGWDSGAASMRGMAKRAGESMDYFGMDAEGSTGKAIKSGLQSAGTNLAMLPLGLARGLYTTASQAATTVAGLMGLSVGADAYNEARDAGKGKLASAAFGIPQGVFEFVFEKIPAHKLFGDLAANAGLWRTLKHQAFSETWTEQMTTLAQDFNEWMNMHPEKTLAEFLAERPEAAYQTLVATLVGVGVQTSTIHGINKAVEKATDQRLQFQQDAFEKLQKLAAQSALRERSPEQFRALIQQTVDASDTAQRSIHVDAQVLNQLSPEILAQLPEQVRAQIPAEAAKNGTVEIPMADVLTVAPGTPLEQILNDHARMTPESMSRADAQAAGDQSQVLRQEAEKVIQQAADQQAAQAEYDQVQQMYAQQVAASGRYRPAVAEQMGHWLASFYTAYGARTGMTATQMQARYPVRVLGAAPADTSGGVMDQPKLGEMTVEGYHFSAAERPVVSTALFGTGLQGSSKDEYLNAADKRLSKRAYFYVDKGTGINPEAGVGGIGHRATLSNVYDSDTDPLRLKTGRNKLGFESAVLDAGFSGYLTRLEGTQSGHVIMLGDQAIKTEVLGPTTKTTGQRVAPAGERASLGRDVIVDALNADKALPSGSPTLERWQELLARTPEVLNALRAAGVFDGNQKENVYKSDLVKRFIDATNPPDYQAPLKRAVASGVLFRAQDTGRLLLVRRGGNVDNGGTWSVVSGAIEPGETPEAAALREAGEEIGFTGSPALRLWTQTSKDGVVFNTYVADVPTEFGATLNDENTHAEWFEPNALPNLLHPGLRESLAVTGGVFEQRVKTMTPAIRKLLKSLTPEEQAKVTDLVAEKILSVMQDLPSSKEMAAVAYAGRAKRGWYKNSADAISTVFGADAPRFAALLAAMSPQTSVENNLFNALATWKNWVEAGRPTTKAEIVAVMGRSVMGSKLTDSVLPAWVNNSVRALTDADPGKLTLSGPKVHSFMRNLVGVVDEVTNDAWMANYALVDQKIFAGGLNVAGTDPGKGKGYLAMSARVREAAATLTKLTGETWTPAEVQETIWSWAKTLYETAESAGETRTARQIVEERALSDEAINATPDFSTLFSNPTYAKILEDAGYGAQLESLARRSDAAEGQPRTGGEAAPFAAEDQLRLELQAARRLERLADARGDASAAAREQRRDQELDDVYGQDGNRSGRQAGAGPAPLPGAPVIDGATGPDPRIVAVAEQYARDNGIDLRRQGAYVQVDEARAARIAQAYAEMAHDPQNPAVQEAYADLIRQTMAQYLALQQAGYKFWFIDPTADPYKSPWDAMRDLRANQSMGVFPTDAGFGSSEADVSGNPLLADTGLEWPDQHGTMRPVLANDLFRAVHDAFGHGLEGAGFRAQGEENAWQAHVRLFTGPAIGAITSETRGQNSWLNYGPHGETNRTAKVEDTVFADQKTGLMPEWTWTEGRAADATQDTFNQADQPAELNIGLADPKGGENLTPEQVARAVEGAGGLISSLAVHISDTEPTAVVSLSRALTPEQVHALSEALGQEAIAQRNADGTGGLFGPNAAAWGDFNPEFFLRPDGTRASKNTLAQREAQTPRGTFNPATLDLVLNPNANLSTFFHETGHFFLEVMADIASQPGAPTQIVEDMNTFLKWAGVKDLATWNALDLEGKRAAHERWAESIEQYVMEGKAPSLELQPLMRRFATWLKSVYGSIKQFLASRGQAASGGATLGQSGETADAVYKEMAADQEMIDALEVYMTSGDAPEGALNDKLMKYLRRLPPVPADSYLTFYRNQPRGARPWARGWSSWTINEDQTRYFGGRDFEILKRKGAQGLSLEELGQWRTRLTGDYHQYGSQGEWLLLNDSVFNHDGPLQVGPQMALNDDIRRVMDRMLATDQQIAQANEVAGLLPDLEADALAAERLNKRSMGDLKWAVRAFDSVIAKLRKQATAAEKALREEVTVEVDQMPEMRAKAALDALNVNTEYASVAAEHKAQRKAAEAAAKAEITQVLLESHPDVKGLAKGQLLAKNKRDITNKVEAAMIKWDAEHPAPSKVSYATEADVATVADSFGYESVDAMLQAIDAFGSRRDAIDGMTQQRMLQEHGDLTDEDAIRQAALEAVHNEARARSLATELRTQREMLNPRQDTGEVNVKGSKITVNALVEAAKQFAANVVARTPLRDLKSKAWQHTAAERRAGQRWQEATAAGKTQEAVQAKQDQMLNNAAAKAALDARQEMGKILAFFKRVVKGTDEKVVEKGRDPDVVNAARAVLGAYGIETPASKGAAAYLETLQRNDPDLHAVIAPMVEAATRNAQPIEALTFEELQALHEEIAAMWHLAKSSRQMEVDGDLMDIEDAAAEVRARMEAIGIPNEIPGETGALTKKDERVRWLQFAGALLRRVEQWAEGMDGKFGGPFLRYIYQPVKEAANRYRTDKVEYRKKFQALVDAVAPTMTHQLIAAPELGYTFGRGHNGIGHAELLHALLHTGNESNKRKLLLGRNWAVEGPDGQLDTSKWDAFIARMVNTGVLQPAHYNFAQGVWDLLEETKPLAQKAHRDVFGRYFAEVTADPFTDPWGQARRGGYVPAQADPNIVTDDDIRALAEAENESMAYSFPTTNKGFTKARVEYNRPLKLDLRTIPQHIDKVLLFSHMEPAVRGVSKLLRQKTVSQALSRIDPSAYSGMLLPWLNRSAKQIVETPIMGDGRTSRVLSALRSRAGAALMFGNISNTLQQVSGFTSAFSKLKADGLDSHMTRTAAAFIANPKQMKAAVAEKSEYMATRMDGEIAAMTDAMNDILLKPSLYEKAQSWAMRHSYFLQSALDNTTGPIIWTAAYNGALEKGHADAEAVRYADSVIRQTQGANSAEDVSRIETGPAYARVFTQFIGYFNMLANTNATALKQIAGEMGLKKGAGKALGVVFFGVLAPIWVAEAIAQAFKGGPDDKDKDGYLDDWLAAVFGMGTIKGLLAQVPFIAQVGQVVVNRFNTNPADDRFSLSPAVSLLESAASVPYDIYKQIVDGAHMQKLVRDSAALVSLATGLPAAAVARPAGYAAGIADNKIQPTGPVDAVRGAVTGTTSPESKVK